MGNPGIGSLEPLRGANSHPLVMYSIGELHGMVDGQSPHVNHPLGSLKHSAFTYWGHSGGPIVTWRERQSLPAPTPTPTTAEQEAGEGGGGLPKKKKATAAPTAAVADLDVELVAIHNSWDGTYATLAPALCVVSLVSVVMLIGRLQWM